MSSGNGRFMFAGHAVGAAARFHRLDDLENLNYVSSTLGASVLPVTGGRCEAASPAYRFEVDTPRQRCLFAVGRVATWAEGRDANGVFETEVNAEIQGLEAVDKLYVDFVRLHMLSTSTGAGDPVVTTQGNRIDGMRLGNVEARVTVADDPLHYTGTADQLVNYYRGQGKELPKYGEHYGCSLVTDIQLVGSEQDKQDMSVVDGHIIVWKGFGRIILGEVHVKGHERRLTMVRLAMGSDAGGTATAADGQSNGVPTTG